MTKRPFSLQYFITKTALSYRSHFAFIEDVLDSHIIPAGMRRWGIDDLDSNPRCNKMPSVLLMMSNEDKLSWLYEQADIILNSMRHNVPSVSNSIQSLRHSLDVINVMKTLLTRIYQM